MCFNCTCVCVCCTTLWSKITSPISISLWFLQTLTNCYNIWHIVCRVNLQHNNYGFICLTILLLHRLGENEFSFSKNLPVCTRWLSYCSMKLVWLPNSPVLNPADYWIWGMMQDRMQSICLKKYVYLLNKLMYQFATWPTWGRAWLTLVAKHCRWCYLWIV